MRRQLRKPRQKEAQKMRFSQLIQEYISLRQRAARGQLEPQEQKREKELQQGLMLAQIDIPSEIEEQKNGFVRILDGEKVLDWPLLINDEGLLSLKLHHPWDINEERVALLTRGPDKDVQVVRCRVTEKVAGQALRVWVQLDDEQKSQAANDNSPARP